MEATGGALVGEACGVVYGESIPNGGMLSENPVAVAFMNLASAMIRVGEDQSGNAGSSDGTVWRKQYLAQSRGVHPKMAWVKVSSSLENLGHTGRMGSFHHEDGGSQNSPFFNPIHSRHYTVTARMFELLLCFTRGDPPY